MTPARRSQARRSRFGSAARTAGRILFAPIGIVVGTVRRLPRPVQAVVVVLVVAGTAVGGYQTVSWFQKRQTTRLVHAEWRAFQQAASGRPDADALRGHLDRILAADPTDARALQLRAALESGVSPAGDPPTARLLLSLHMAAGRRADAAREAAVWLAAHPHDRLARVLVTEEALARGDRAAADAHLTTLADDGSAESIDPVGLVAAYRLLGQTGRDPSKLRELIVGKVVPALRRDDLTAAPPGVQASLVGCYAVAVTAPALPDGVAGYWVPAARLAELAVAAGAEAGDAGVLAQVGQWGPALAVGLERLERAGQVTADERKPLAAELEDRTRRAWAGVLAKRPADPEAFAGRVRSWRRSGDAAAAVAELDRGQAVCGDHLSLVRLRLDAELRADRPAAGLEAVWAAAERHPADPAYWVLAVDAATLAGRRERAIEACRRARAAAPGRADVAAYEARLWAEAGRAREALAAAAGVPDADLARHPASARPIAQALAVAEPGRLEAFITHARSAADPAPLTAVADGLLDAPPDPARAARATELAAEVLARWPATPAAARVRATALVRRLELGPPRWDAKQAKEAAAACELAVAVAPDDLPAAARLAWVRLRGLNQPAAALAAADPLRKAAALDPAAAEVLGAVYLANGRAADAVRVLEPAAASADRDRTAGCRVQLARAYHAAARPAAAEQMLASAAGLPMSDRERADYQDAYEAVRRR